MMIQQTSNPLTEALEAELRRLRQDTADGRRITALEVLLGEDGLQVELATPARAPAPRGPGVSQAKLRAVRQYLESHGQARQVDVAKDLDENSGSVSLALRALEAEGVAEDTGVIDGKSKVWRYTGEPSNDRVVNVVPGEGVSEGRRR
jgi:hypothetical protein